MYITNKQYCWLGLYPPDRNPYIFIGESNPDLAFALHIYDNIPDLEAWKNEWKEPGTLIVTHKGEPVSPIDMLTIITLRKSERTYASHSRNFTPGSHGLLHAVVGSNFSFYKRSSYCIGNEDTYDLFR